MLETPVVVNADMKIYFWTEAFWYMGFLALSALAILYFGELQGIGVAFVVLYFALVVYYLQYVRRVYGLQLTRDLVMPWLLGFAVVIMASTQNWNSTTVNWISSLLWIVGSFGLGIAFVKKSERDMILNKLRLMLRMN